MEDSCAQKAVLSENRSKAGRLCIGGLPYVLMCGGGCRIMKAGRTKNRMMKENPLPLTGKWCQEASLLREFSYFCETGDMPVDFA